MVRFLTSMLASEFGFGYFAIANSVQRCKTSSFALPLPARFSAGETVGPIRTVKGVTGRPFFAV